MKKHQPDRRGVAQSFAANTAAGRKAIMIGLNIKLKVDDIAIA